MFQLVLKLMTSQLGKAVGLLIFLVLLFIVRSLVFPGSPIIYWIAVAVVAVLLWIGWAIYKNRKSKEANEAITGALVDGAQADEASASPQKREVYRKAKENLQYAMSLLEKSRPKGYEGSALYRLPWILVVGPPSDGKTTAIANAGIRWPQDPRFDEAGGGAKKRGIDGAGGTRSCNWFFSSDAIILDTAGRWQARDQGDIDENEWLQFLDMLQKYRPKRPVNGIIALISIERILAGRETSQEWAQKVRRQVNEVMEKLGTHVPVYLVFNKCDLIHGFVEFFQDLDKESRKQMWGFTRKYKPLLRKSGEGQESERDTILEDLDREMDSLHEVLEQRRLHRLSDTELIPSERAALCIFPGEFSQMREHIREFISDAFYENPYGHNPTLRGVYFTSATQYEGNPILQLMKQVAGEYDIPAEALPLSTRQAVDTYFLHDLMLDVVFKDEQLGGRFKKSLFDRSRKMVALGLGLATLLLSVWMGVSYAVNSGKNDRIIAKIQVVKQISASSTNAVDAIIALDSLRTGIEDYASTGFPFGVFYWAFGRGDHGDITEAARKWMASKAEDVFVTDAWRKCTTVLGKMPSRNLARYISSYRTYLYLSNGPGSHRVDPGTVADYVIAGGLFRGVADLEERAGYRRLLKELLKSYSKMDSTKAFEYKEGLVEYAQNAIRSKWSWRDLLEELVENEPGLYEPLSAGEIESIESQHEIPHAFTFSGWNDYLSDRLDSAYTSIREDSLIAAVLVDKLGDNSGKNPLIDEFNRRCKYEWTQFFDGLDYTKEAARSSDFFATLAGYDSPFSKLLERASQEAIKDGELKRFFADLHKFTGVSPSGGILDSLSPSSSSNDKPPAIDAYIVAIGNVNSSLDAMRGSSEGCAGKYKSAVSKIRGAQKDVKLNYARSELSYKLTDFLVKPFTIGKRRAGAMAASCLNRGWTSFVYDDFVEDFQPMYPFTAGANDDVSDASIGEFFANDGPLRQFDKEEAIPTKKATGMRLSSQYKAVQEVGRKISRLIRSGNTTVDFEFNSNLTPTGMRHLRVFESDRPIFRYANGPPDTLRMKLPWSLDRLNIHVTMDNDNQVASPLFSGSWAPLRLMDWARTNKREGTLRFDGGVSVRFKLPNGSPLQLFREFKLPKSVNR